MASLNWTLRDSAAEVAVLLTEVGEARVKWVEIFRDHLVVHPARRSEGEAIADQLGINVATDYPATRPGFTLWTGSWKGIDMYIYGELREVVPRIRPW